MKSPFGDATLTWPKFSLNNQENIFYFDFNISVVSGYKQRNYALFNNYIGSIVNKPATTTTPCPTAPAPTTVTTKSTTSTTTAQTVTEKPTCKMMKCKTSEQQNVRHEELNIRIVGFQTHFFKLRDIFFCILCANLDANCLSDS